MLKKTDDELKLEKQIMHYHKQMSFMLLLRKLNLLRQLSDKRGDAESCVKWCREILHRVKPSALEELKLEEVREATSILRDTHTMLGRDNFHHFLIAMEWNRAKKERFYEPRMGVLRECVQDLQDLADGKISVYGLSMPPRTGKSTLGILYICWMAGRTPNKSILGAGYSASLVQSFYDGALEFLTSEEYRFADIFPDSPVVDTSAKGLTLDLKDPRRYKSITFRSIDGTVTGATEASSLLYLDDLVSGIEEALNLDRLNTLWTKTTVNMLQRMKQGCPLLIIGTRWSVHDPLYKLYLEYENKPHARFKILPALDDNGESNFNYAYGVGFDKDHYARLKSQMDNVSWECVFMQNPIERDGLLFPEDSLKRYFSLPEGEPDQILMVCDCAFGGDDYLSAPVAYVFGDTCYVEDVVFMNKADYKVTEPLVTAMIVQHGVQIGDFESNNGGDFYARDVEKMLKTDHPNVSCTITWEKAPTTMSKLSRIVQFSADIKELYFKDNSIATPMYKAFMRNLTTFLQTGKSPHDDAPDSLAKLCKRRKVMVKNQVILVDRRSIGL